MARLKTVIVTVFMTLAPLNLSRAEESVKSYDFDVHEETLGEALTVLSVQARAGFLYPYELAERTGVQPVHGRYTVLEALGILLRGTEFSADLTTSGVITVSLAKTKSISGREGEMADGKLRKGLLTGVAMFLFGGANAQDVAVINAGADGDANGEERDEIIVTGTNIRGVENIASPLTVITREDIDRQGFATTQQLLQSLPQNLDSGENTSATAREANDGAPTGTAGVNIRGLGVGATLTLINGRRVAAGGQIAQVVDVSLIPLSAVERVEVLTDGASAIYGTDAIAGVVNFILRDDFDGAETRLRFGGVTEGSSQEYQAAQTVGKSWNTGNFLASYEYYRRNSLDTRSKSFTEDAPDPSDILPRTVRHSIIVNGEQQLSEAVRLFGNAAYSVRDTTARTASESIVIGDTASTAEREAEQIGATFGASIKLGKDWRSELAGTYSNSLFDSVSETDGLRTGTSESDLDIVVADLRADGPLFGLPAGDVRLAVGGQFRSEGFDYEVIVGSTIVGADVSRDVYAVFGEVYAPVIGEDNRRPGVHSLVLTVAGRFEDYSDFGSSVDPKIGLRYEPTQGLAFRGTYGTSFKAPNFLDLGGVFGGTTLPGLFLTPRPGEAVAPDMLFLNGSNPDLEAEESETWTAGFDYQPTGVLDGLTIQATYYDISFDRRISTPTTGISPRDALNNDTVQSFLTFPSDPEFATLVEMFFPTDPRFNQFGLSPSDIGFVFDGRVQNVASTNVSGVDFSVGYVREADFGVLQLGLNGSYIFEFSQRNLPGVPATDIFNRQFRPVDLRLRGNIGLSRGNFASSLFINYVDSYESDETGVLEPVDSWTTVDINAAYRFDDGRHNAMLNNLRLSLNIVNLFDEEPPFVDQFRGLSRVGQNYDGANANALGRVVSVQLEKSF